MSVAKTMIYLRMVHFTGNIKRGIEKINFIFDKDQQIKREQICRGLGKTKVLIVLFHMQSNAII